LLLQLELVGLSRLGSNPLSVLKDNIPGYTLLREDRSDPPLRTYTTGSAPAPIDR
jgi:LPS-assembly protein